MPSPPATRKKRAPDMGHFQAVKNESVGLHAGRGCQAIPQYAEVLSWNDSRDADTFAVRVTGLLQSQESALPEWITHRQSNARFAQSRERQARRWSGNPEIDPVSLSRLLSGVLRTLRRERSL
jgi:hypothetical protein